MGNSLTLVIILLVLAVILIYVVFRKVGAKLNLDIRDLDRKSIRTILEKKVPLFSALHEAGKEQFLDRVIYFLKTTRIAAEKGALVTEDDKILVAASATIPLIHFETWAYENLDEVILYPDYFNEQYDVQDSGRNIGGMVGTGALSHKMILSLPALRRGFNQGGEGNTAIHEFVHLIDMADGIADGIPEYLIPKDLIEPWLNEMDKTIREIRQGKSDIRDYATTNDAEFLAVTSEYFFKKPRELEKDHPKLYALLDEIYNRKG